MNAERTTSYRSLEAGGAIVLEQAEGMEVRCERGCVWLTQYGDSRDIVLRAGQSFVLSLPTAVVMTAAHGAAIAVREAPARVARGGWLRRLLAVVDPRRGSAVARGLHGRLPPRGALSGSCARNPAAAGMVEQRAL